jgi:hypothetical protein
MHRCRFVHRQHEYRWTNGDASEVFRNPPLSKGGDRSGAERALLSSIRSRGSTRIWDSGKSKREPAIRRATAEPVGFTPPHGSELKVRPDHALF